MRRRPVPTSAPCGRARRSTGAKVFSHASGRGDVTERCAVLRGQLAATRAGSARGSRAVRLHQVAEPLGVALVERGRVAVGHRDDGRVVAREAVPLRVHAPGSPPRGARARSAGSAAAGAAAGRGPHQLGGPAGDVGSVLALARRLLAAYRRERVGVGLRAGASENCLRNALTSASRRASFSCSAYGPARTSSRAISRSSTVEYCIETRWAIWWLRLSRTIRPPRSYGECSSAATKRLRWWK